MSARAFSPRFLVPAAVVVALLQSAVLFYVVASRAAVLRNGAEVRLETAPVDPCDLLRGDYVVLNYAVGRIPAESITGPWPQHRARHAIHVRLAPEANGFWAVREASFGPLERKEGSVVVRGITGRLSSLRSGQTVSVDYGIERYYVPEGEGKAIEKARDGGRISVAARVSEGGVAHIRALLQDGEPLYEEPLY